MATFDGARIPVFASIPSKLDAEQLASREYIYSWLERVGLEPRTVGGSDNSYFNPLHEVRTLARHCAGGVILGYHQVFAKVAEVKVRHEATGEVLTKKVEYRAPTPWNQLETGILFGLGLPLLVLKQRGITGGISLDQASTGIVLICPDGPCGTTRQHEHRPARGEAECRQCVGQRLTVTEAHRATEPLRLSTLRVPTLRHYLSP